MLMISGLEDTDGRNVEEEMQLEGTEHFLKQTGLAKNTEDKRRATVSLPEDKEHFKAGLKHTQRLTHSARNRKENWPYLRTVSMCLKPPKEEILSLK